jgi:hypothetical protein
MAQVVQQRSLQEKEGLKILPISDLAKNINIGLVSSKKLHEIPNSISINSQRICPIRICDS